MARKEFSLAVGEFVRKTNADMDVVVRKLCFEIGRRIIMRSPVDTGRFVHNWLFGVNYLPTAHLGRRDDPKGQPPEPVRADAVQRWAEYTQEARADAEVMWIVNNMPYGYRLEYEGWSKQAPEGMVRITLEEVETMMKKVVAEVRQ